MICIVLHCIYCSLLLALAVPTIIIAHEFYDAFTVHQFQVCVICNIVFSFFQLVLLFLAIFYVLCMLLSKQFILKKQHEAVRFFPF